MASEDSENIDTFMILSICICLASFAVLVMLLRHSGISLGLPIAYLFALLFIHVPGAIAHVVGGSDLTPSTYTETGIWFTAIAAVCFCVGVGVVHLGSKKKRVPCRPCKRRDFAIFCAVAGLFVTYALQTIFSIPSFGAVVDKGGAIWILGVVLGLSDALRRGVPREIILWLVVMCIFPGLTLLRAGFLSFGSTPVFVILAGLVIMTRSNWRVAIGVPLVSLLFFHLFLSYFSNRDDIREAVAMGATMETRIERSLNIIKAFTLFSPDNSAQMRALDDRLNQNYFVGLAAARIDSGERSYLHGRSFWEGAMALIPRAFWPNKPVYAGSPGIIMEMTGFEVNESTSYGVGNVMELHINFGMPSLICGFLMLGLLFGWLDRKAALADRAGDLGQTILYFLPAATMIHPNGSFVELTGTGASAFLAAMGWRWLWINWSALERARGRQKGQYMIGRYADRRPSANAAMPWADGVVGSGKKPFRVTPHE
jgi:hypothetical protein